MSVDIRGHGNVGMSHPFLHILEAIMSKLLDAAQKSPFKQRGDKGIAEKTAVHWYFPLNRYFC